MRSRRFLSMAAASIGLQLAFASIALAHGPTLQATAVCDDTGAPVINFTSTSWSLNPLEGENPQIGIYVNGVKVVTGAYVYPGNSFSGTVAAPAGTSADMAAVAEGTWGDGAAGGQNTHLTVPLPADCPAGGSGRFTGGGSQIRVGGVRITKGLTLHCDLILSNNLEVNWNGHQFHMTEHLTTVSCTDDPAITQAPPAAPLDTMVGIGTGRYDGADGYTVNFTLVDAGEPGTADECALRIFETANPSHVVLDLPLSLLDGGNLQAHFDQPHK